MPKVTALKQQIRNPERVNIFLDGKYSFSLTIDQVLAEKLRVSLELDDTQICELKAKSTDEKLRLRVMNWVMLRPRSVLETRQYIRRVVTKKIDKSAKDEPKTDNTELIIAEFLKRGWLNDQVFAKWWVERTSRQTKSASYLRSELGAKGISREILAEVIGRENDDTSILQLYEKIKSKPKYADETKLVRFLASKGYGYSLIKAVVADAGIDDIMD
jgi:regulatory protein